MSKKRIGVVGWNTGANSFGITKPYFNFISYFGRPVIISPDEEPDKTLDMIIVPGGPDVDTRRYSEVPLIYTGNPCAIRESFDHIQLPWYIKNNIPIFGICRGHQSIAVHFGASLIQDMWHETNKSDERASKVHSQIVATEIKSINMKPGDRFSTNSIHHQVVDIETLSNDEMSLGTIYSPNQNGNKKVKKGTPTVESILYRNYPIATVQWHPEEIWDDYSMRIIEHLLETKKPLI